MWPLAIPSVASWQHCVRLLFPKKFDAKTLQCVIHLVTVHFTQTCALFAKKEKLIQKSYLSDERQRQIIKKVATEKRDEVQQRLKLLPPGCK